MKCKETAGFLISHPCTRQADLTCSTCGKDVCSEHARQVDDGFACLSCYKENYVEEDVNAARSTRRYYHDPYFYAFYHSYHPYSMHDSFDDEDRGAFDSDDAPEGVGVEADADGS